MPRERDMRPVIDVWLTNQGLLPIYEILLSGYVDVTAVRFAPRFGRRIPEVEHIVTVELKLTNVGGVLRQCKDNIPFCHQSYAAMPTERCKRMRTATVERFRASGVGLLAVGEGVHVVVPAADNKALIVWDHLKQKLWRHVRLKSYDAAVKGE